MSWKTWDGIGMPLVVLVATIALTSCSSDGNKPCSAGYDCASGYCNPGTLRCGSTCRTSADCTGGEDCLGAVCVAACPSTIEGYVCDGASHVSCSVADDSFCGVCGCPASGTRCESGVGCVPLSQVGQACDSDDECLSDNCSLYNGVCRVAVGAACTSANCDQCITATNGFAYCSRECSYDGDCGAGQCLGDSTIGYFTCRPPCSTFADPSCPGTCKYPSGGGSTKLFCDCPSCTISGSPRILGAQCDWDSDCASGDCLARHLSFSFYNISSGFCTHTCSSDAQCGAGTHCVDVPCAPGDSSARCGALCLRDCSTSYDCPSSYKNGGGTCRSLTRHGASGSATVCDARTADGQFCGWGSDCMSGKCVGTTCVAAGGSPNGAACVVHANCASGNCLSQVCRGGNITGDRCTNTNDCYGGTCCSSGVNANTCAQTCP